MTPGGTRFLLPPRLLARGRNGRFVPHTAEVSLHAESQTLRIALYSRRRQDSDKPPLLLAGRPADVILALAKLTQACATTLGLTTPTHDEPNAEWDAAQAARRAP